MATQGPLSPTLTAINVLAAVGQAAVQLGLVTDDQLQHATAELRKQAKADAKSASTERSPATRAVSVKVAAERLGCCHRTVRRMIAAGSLPTVRLTGSRKSLRILESAIDALLQ